jgi:GNAT superfamily N-acetyltransferase
VADFTVARWDQAKRLTELQQVVHDSFRAFSPPSSVLDETLERFAARFHDGIVLVAQSGDAVIGSVFGARTKDSLYLARMAVLPAWRRRGIGAALMRAAENEARRLNLPTLTLRVRKTLPENRRYFESFGFAVNGEGQDPGRTPYYAMQRLLS